MGLLKTIANTAKGFVDSAAKFLKLDVSQDIPRYMHGKNYNKQFFDELADLSDNDIPDFVKQYSQDAYRQIIFDSINGGTRLDAFNRLHKNAKSEILESYNRQHKLKAKTDFLNAANALDYGDAFQINSQKQLDKIYKTINQNGFELEYMDRQVRLAEHGRGMFADEFKNFDFSNGGRKLTKEQMQTLGTYFNEHYGERVGNFTADYVAEASEQLPDRLNYNLGMQKKYLRTKEGQRQMELLNDPKSIVNKPNTLLNRFRGKEGEYETVYKAYKDHLTETLVNQPSIDDTWSKPLSVEEFASTKGYGISDSQKIVQPFNSSDKASEKMQAKKIASGDPDHSGISLWKVASVTGAITAGAICVAGLFEDEDRDYRG